MDATGLIIFNISFTSKNNKINSYRKIIMEIFYYSGIVLVKSPFSIRNITGIYKFNLHLLE